jgi:hypothetical protein
MAQYRKYLQEAGLEIATSAFYASSKNLVIAGSDLDSYARRLQTVREHNDQVRRQYRELKAAFTSRLATVIEEMKRRGFSEAEIEQEVKLRSTVWQREYDEAMSRLELAKLQNEAKFAEVTGQMFRRLYHEAFHAYVENYFCPDPQATLPRWLNEGLAQIFESGQLEADTLRIDAPDPKRLADLQADLSGDQPLPLSHVLAADEQDFLDVRTKPSVQRHYVYAWGLAYYLTFEGNLLSPEILDPYVINEGRFGPTARFTRLVGMPLSKFERQWRQTMLGLRP